MMENQQMFAESQQKPKESKMGRTPEKAFENLVGVFTDPIIAYPSAWMDTIPDMIKEQVTIQRLIAAIAGDEMATDAEVAAYIYPRTLEAPIDHDWTQIYLYVTTKTCEMAHQEVPEDIRVTKLTDWEMNDLNDLKRWIYKKRIEARGGRRREEKQQAKIVEARELPIVPEQYSLF
jgi:hypothetical protein